MLGFKETQEIMMKTDGMIGTVKQEVRVIDGSLFLTHWHVEEQYWSYDQLSKELMDTYDFSVPKRQLLETIWENLEDVVLALNTLRFERGTVDEKTVKNLTIRNI